MFFIRNVSIKLHISWKNISPILLYDSKICFYHGKIDAKAGNADLMKDHIHLDGDCVIITLCTVQSIQCILCVNRRVLQLGHSSDVTSQSVACLAYCNQIWAKL